MRVEVIHDAGIDIDVAVYRVSPSSGLPSLIATCSQPTSPEECEVDLIAGDILVATGSSLQRDIYLLSIEVM